MYEYRCKVLRVVDGDTVVALVDLGFAMRIEEKFRLGGIDAPELFSGDNRDAGRAAKEHLEKLIERYQPLTIRTEKHRGKWGRWIGWLYADGGFCLNWAMVTDGHAVKWG